jgi:hypothetical protein
MSSFLVLARRCHRHRNRYRSSIDRYLVSTAQRLSVCAYTFVCVYRYRVVVRGQARNISMYVSIYRCRHSISFETLLPPDLALERWAHRPSSHARNGSGAYFSRPNILIACVKQPVPLTTLTSVSATHRQCSSFTS